MIDEFYKRIYETAKSKGMPLSKLAKSVGITQKKQIEAISVNRSKGKLPSVKTIIAWSSLFTPYEIRDILEIKLGNNHKIRHSDIDLAEKFVDELFEKMPRENRQGRSVRRKVLQQEYMIKAWRLENE